MNNRRLEKYLSALLTSSTQKEAAEKAGISSRWMREIMRDPEFAAEYARRKAAVVDDATRHIQGVYNKAIKTLESIIDSQKASNRDRINAARAVLEYGQQLTETNDVLTRIDDVERRADT